VVDRRLSRWQVTEVERFLRHTIGPDGGQRRLFCVLTDDTDPANLPGFLRNLRHLSFAPGVALDLHDLITGTPTGEVDLGREALRNAASALRAVPDRLPSAGRLSLVEDTVHGMSTALDNGELTTLRDLSVDLGVLSKPHTAGGWFTPSHGLLADIQTLLARIDRRIDASTN
jgi:hypothetical protein